MKQGIHPNYVETQVTCSCGNVFTTRSTKENLRTDLCNVCHPFYTGEQRIIDTAGQVERFNRRLEAASANSGNLSKRQRRLAARQQANPEESAEDESTSPETESETEEAPVQA